MLLDEWNDHLNKNRALVQHYFGKTESAEFLINIHGKFKLSDEYLRYRKSFNAGPQKGTDQDSLLKRSVAVLDDANRTVYRFDIALLDKLKSDSVLKSD